jgi:hypothetical protein
MVQVIITYGIASFSWKYDINYFDFNNLVLVFQLQLFSLTINTLTT